MTKTKRCEICKENGLQHYMNCNCTATYGNCKGLRNGLDQLTSFGKDTAIDRIRPSDIAWLNVNLKAYKPEKPRKETNQMPVAKKAAKVTKAKAAKKTVKKSVKKAVKKVSKKK